MEGASGLDEAGCTDHGRRWVPVGPDLLVDPTSRLHGHHVPLPLLPAAAACGHAGSKFLIELLRKLDPWNHGSTVDKHCCFGFVSIHEHLFCVDSSWSAFSTSLRRQQVMSVILIYIRAGRWKRISRKIRLHFQVKTDSSPFFPFTFYRYVYVKTEKTNIINGFLALFCFYVHVQGGEKGVNVDGVDGKNLK